MIKIRFDLSPNYNKFREQLRHKMTINRTIKLFHPISMKTLQILIRNNKIDNNLLSKSESVKFSLIESVICLFTDSSVKKYFSLSNQSIFTEIISEI